MSSAAAMRSVARVERRKLMAQVPLRLLVLTCLLAPFAFAVLLKIQSGAPSDALFGAWVHTSGYAVSLVVLGFAANWGFPIIAGVLAGDLFAAEDRHGTWKTILTRSRSPWEIFAGKVLAVGVLVAGLSLLVAISSLVAGLSLVGGRGLVDLGGAELAPAHLLLLVSLSWLICLLPVLAYTSLAILFSVTSRNGIVGVLGPLLVALLTQLLALIGHGFVVHMLLIGSAFDAWHGLFAAHPYFGPLGVAVLVCAAWILGALGLSWVVFRRREFVAGAAEAIAPGGSAGRVGHWRTGWRAPVRIAAAATLGVAFLAVAGDWGPAGVTAGRLSGSFTPQFRRLTLLQQGLLGHPIPAGAHYRILPVCGRHSAKPVGPGDWTCTMNVYILLAAGTQPLTDTPVAYDLSVQSNGCYKAQAPPGTVGPPQIRDVGGRVVVNPLATIYGCFNVL